MINILVLAGAATVASLLLQDAAKAARKDRHRKKLVRDLSGHPTPLEAYRVEKASLLTHAAPDGYSCNCASCREARFLRLQA